MLVEALASPKFLGDGLLIALASVRQRELCPPVEVVFPEPFSLSSFTLACPEDSPEDSLKESLQDSPQDSPQDTVNAPECSIKGRIEIDFYQVKHGRT